MQADTTVAAWLKTGSIATRRSLTGVFTNARYHHSKETQRFIADQDGDIQLAFLPAYAPEFNPDKEVWNHLKARLGKRAIMSKCDMKRHVLSILRSIQNQTELVKSFFRMPDTKYILAALA